MSVTIITNKPQATVFAIFGSGLIGSELIRIASILCAEPVLAKFCFNWQSHEQLRSGVSRVMKSVQHNNAQRLEVFWCAGQGGFSASRREMDNESNILQVVLSEFCRQGNCAICFNFLSSAGGLYEGLSGTVGDNVSPAPIRPYGISKLEQEQMLKASGLLFRIYRPTTVYGSVPVGGRQGLVSTLVKNTFNQVSTTVHASPDTLRDYLYVTDLAKIMLLNAVSNAKAGTAQIIASGRVVPIYYLLEKVKSALGRRPRVNFISSLGNDKNMSYCTSALPKRFALTSLEEGVRLLGHQQWAV